MSQKLAICGGSALALLLATTAVQADVTAKQVWDNWKASASSWGQSVTVNVGSETMSGDMLTVRDIEFRGSDKAANSTIRIPEIDLREQGDGSVAVTMSPQIEGTFEVTPPDLPPSQFKIVVKQQGAKTVVSGSPGDMTYANELPSGTVTVNGTAIDGTANDAKSTDLKIELGMIGVKSKTLIKGTDMRTLAASSSMDSVTYTVSAHGPEGGGDVDMKGKLTGLTSTINMTLLEKQQMADMVDLSAALKQGLAMDMSASYGSSETVSDFTNKGSSVHSEASGGGGNLEFAFDKNRLSYGASGKDMKMTITGSQIPVPSVTVQLGEVAAHLLMPTSKSDTPQDFGLLVKLAGLKVNDEVWSMFDPQKVLPRDPATLVVDLAGKANWLFDIFDPAQQKAPPKQPGQIHALDLKSLDVAAAGAELTGTGSFTFDNSDMTTFNGMPKPTGSVDLKLVGGNGLIDNLVKMGLVPADQASGARMMLGLFARPGDGPDTMVSKIEVTPEGEVLANGQRLQ